MMIQKARAKLSRDLGDWREYQLKNYHHVSRHVPLVDFHTPEEEALKLPSAFDATSHTSLGLDQLAKIELQLREGQAYDALQALRQVIQEWNHSLLDKKDNVYGIAESTRAQSFMRALAADKLAAANDYRRAWRAMIQLGLSADDHHWRELKDDQLWGKNVTVVRSMGDSKNTDPWFWSVVRPKGLSEAAQKEWSIESELCLYSLSYNCLQSPQWIV